MLKKLSYIFIGLSVLVVIVIVAWILMDSSEIEQPKVPDSTTLRSTTHGDYVGFSDLQGTRAWLGIGYAQPPVGELRWKAPLPPEPHIDTIQALNFKNACPQLASAMTTNEVNATASGYVGSEDCLYLNVWSVPNAVGRPVMVWIHGGGNSIGSARFVSRRDPGSNRERCRRDHQLSLGFLGLV